MHPTVPLLISALIACADKDDDTSAGASSAGSITTPSSSTTSGTASTGVVSWTFAAEHWQGARVLTGLSGEPEIQELLLRRHIAPDSSTAGSGTIGESWRWVDERDGVIIIDRILTIDGTALSGSWADPWGALTSTGALRAGPAWAWTDWDLTSGYTDGGRRGGVIDETFTLGGSLTGTQLYTTVDGLQEWSATLTVDPTDAGTWESREAQLLQH